MNKMKNLSALLIVFVTVISLFTGCKSKPSQDYAFFGKYSANSIVYTMATNPGTVNSSYDISAEKFVIYSSDKKVSVEIENPEYIESSIEGTAIEIEYGEIDISEFTSKKQYDIKDPEEDSSNYRVYILDDDLWFAAYDYNEAKEREEIMYIYSLKASEK